ncbi:MAG: tRNA uridine-5-carboxymethylaminomethyl(34) synthesis GTPase MnmE [Anaerovoracaceae bacterium]|nr:tRNA uridine-5-carboxymethylaminomethyl(34) synthesis GTPase MnmE [Anaerovoracaceae bacterium]
MEDTIAAISTAFGEGGIGIVRMSGENAKQIMDKVFVSDSEPRDRRLTYGHIVDPDTGETIDEVLAVYMKAPDTYTKEDIVEIDNHGSVVALRKTLSLVLRCGARLAEKGEFTKRAFLNGRIDLTQAEAVMDVVSAKTDSSYDTAVSQLEGRLADEIRDVRKRLLDQLVEIAVNIDYPDEDIEPVLYGQLKNSISSIGDEINVLIDSCDTGRMIRDGIKIAICGRPNVGKSSLMNALLRESRAIVTEIPGTTRDTIEESMSIRGLPVVLTDTAGIRDTDDKIERIGIRRAKESIENADLVIFVLDAQEGIADEDIEILDNTDAENALILINKTDLGNNISPAEAAALRPGADIILTSMKDNTGIDEVENRIEDLVYGGELRQRSSLIITNARQESLLREAGESLESALSMAEAGEALDFIDMDLRRAYETLGKIIGESVEEDVLNEVFSRFCLGK